MNCAFLGLEKITIAGRLWTVAVALETPELSEYRLLRADIDYADEVVRQALSAAGIDPEATSQASDAATLAAELAECTSAHLIVHRSDAADPFTGVLSEAMNGGVQLHWAAGVDLGSGSGGDHSGSAATRARRLKEGWLAAYARSEAEPLPLVIRARTSPDGEKIISLTIDSDVFYSHHGVADDAEWIEAIRQGETPPDVPLFFCISEAFDLDIPFDVLVERGPGSDAVAAVLDQFDKPYQLVSTC